jgi:Uncharacterised protein family (UPF0259)
MIQKISKATELLIRNLPLYSAIVLTVWLPASILQTYLRLYVFPVGGGGDLAIAMKELQFTNLLEIAFGPLVAGSLFYATDQLHQGWPVTYGQSMRYGAKQSFRLLGARIAYGFIVLLGLLALIIPGIWMAVRFALIDPIVVLERLNGFEARDRSAELTQGIRWKIFGTTILATLWIILISTLLDLPLSLLGQSQSFVAMVISGCIINILMTILLIVIFLFYWEAKQIAPENPHV